MKVLKNVAIFLAGGMSFAYFFAKGASQSLANPKEGSILYEDDNLKIVRLGSDVNTVSDLAAVRYKNKNSDSKDEKES